MKYINTWDVPVFIRAPVPYVRTGIDTHQKEISFRS